MERNTYIIIGIPVLLVGGTEYQTIAFTRVLISAGIRVTVCCYFNEYDPAMVKAFEQAGAEVVLLGLERSSGLFHLLRKLKAFFSQQSPDAVHVRYIAPGLIPILAARLASVKNIFAVVGQSGRLYGLLPRLLIRIALQLADCIICTSQAVERSWFGSGSLFRSQGAKTLKKHFTIYNSIDIETIRNTSSDANRDILLQNAGIDEGHIITCVGRLRNEKGQKFLLKAFKTVLNKAPDTFLVLIGDGPDRSKLEKLADDIGITSNIRFMGSLEQPQVFSWYGITDVLAVPSLQEGFGLVAAEAMAASVPVIASDVDGLSEVVENNVTGLLCPAGDTKALSKAIITLLLNTENNGFMKGKSLERARLLFSQEQYRDAILDVYRKFQLL